MRKGARLILNQYPNGLFRIVDTEYHISYVLFARGKSIRVFHVDAAFSKCSEQFHKAAWLVREFNRQDRRDRTDIAGIFDDIDRFIGVVYLSLIHI